MSLCAALRLPLSRSGSALPSRCGDWWFALMSSGCGSTTSPRARAPGVWPTALGAATERVRRVDVNSAAGRRPVIVFVPRRRNGGDAKQAPAAPVENGLAHGRFLWLPLPSRKPRTNLRPPSQGGTCGDGMRGQKAKTGIRSGFEGGQMPLYRRMPKLKGIAGGAAPTLPVATAPAQSCICWRSSANIKAHICHAQSL